MAGQDVEPDNSVLFRQIGFSPQDDPLWPVITLEEHMHCYAELRGIPQSDVETIVRR